MKAKDELYHLIINMTEAEAEQIKELLIMELSRVEKLPPAHPACKTVSMAYASSGIIGATWRF